MARRRRQAFVWIPRVQSTAYSIEIDGVDVTDDATLGSQWTWGIFGFECLCTIKLIDADGKYAETYVGGETIELKLDFSSGTTSIWKGTLKKPKRRFGTSIELTAVGSHYQSDLLDITVTEEYLKTKTADAILKDLVDNYLTGYTYTNVLTCTTVPTIRWDNKPLWDCIVDLCELAGFDCYLDSDKDFHFFERESIENTTDAIVWNDNMLSILSFGNNVIEIKNRIIVYGEDDNGLPIIYRTDDATSQVTYGIKEKVIKDTSIKTYEQAKNVGDTELELQKSIASQGEIDSLILPDIRPGDMIWISNPVQRINGQFRIVKFTHYLPEEITKVIIAKENTLPQLFKERKKAELGLQKIINPFKMTNSYNFPFDNTDNIDDPLSSGVTVLESNLKISTGAIGTMISNLRTATEDITAVHLKVIGDTLAGTQYFISTDNGDTYTEVNLETKTFVTAGTQLRVKVILNSTSTRLDSLAVLYT